MADESAPTARAGADSGVATRPRHVMSTFIDRDDSDCPDALRCRHVLPGARRRIVSLADELLKLEALKNSGSLTESEFESAKHMLLRDPESVRDADTPSTMRPPVEPRPIVPTSALPAAGDASLGRAMNRYVDFKNMEHRSSNIVAIIGVIAFILIALVMFAKFSGTTDPDPMFPEPGACTSVVGGSLSC